MVWTNINAGAGFVWTGITSGVKTFARIPVSPPVMVIWDAGLVIPVSAYNMWDNGLTVWVS